MKRLTPIAATLSAFYLAALALTASAEPTLERGKQIATTVCAACHGADGNSAIPANPNLAAQGERYIVTQLKAYKSGARDNAIMKGMAAALSDDDMASVAMYFSRQTPKPAAVATDKALVAHGQQLYRVGNARLGIPACAGCHGPAGQGIPAQYPRLAGQWASFTEHELESYASNKRKHPVMSAIAERLSDKDIKAVSDYIAGLRDAK